MECFRLNAIRWLFPPPRRLRRTRIILWVIVAVAVLNLYSFNSERFPHDRLIRRKDGKMVNIPATAADLNLQMVEDSENRQRLERGYENRNEGNKIARPVPHPSLQTTEDAENTDGDSSDSLQALALINATLERGHSRCKDDLFITNSNKHTYGTCIPHKATDDACRHAERLYFYDPSSSECKKNKEKNEICSLSIEIVLKKRVLKAKCDGRICRKFQTYKDRKSQRDSLIFGVFVLDPEEGHLKSTKNFSQVLELETQLPQIAFISSKNKFDFVFVKCFSAGNNQTLISQLITIPAVITTEKAPKQRTKNMININIVLLDSVSRPHFYRSLPKTIQTFKRLALRSNSSTVFDFELFQAVHGHTTQNEHALFTGQLLPDIDPEERSPSVKPEVLFGQFKTAGYQTLWQEDLCWTSGWGLVTDLAADDWEKLQRKLKKSFVDSTGLTHSSCEVLGSYGVDCPFNGPEQICYNGRLQHDYFLKYTADLLATISASRKYSPLFSFTALNVGHDDEGRRIQSLDTDLTRYVTTVAANQDTITILLADHGNTYTEFTSTSLEGRFEMFHPSLFLIVPNKVAGLLGKDAMTALEVNQRRLVTMIDLHHSLMSLAGPIARFANPTGIFAQISPGRTCNDIELRIPNLCVCEGWDSPTTNDSSKISLVEFAVGELNNMILAQLTKVPNNKVAKQYPVLGACERLRPLRFENVRERSSREDRALITTFDIYVRAGNVVRHDEDVFHLEVKSKKVAGYHSMEMELIHFDRLTLFGKYGLCADQDVQLKLCICSEEKDRQSKAIKLENVPWADYTTFLVKSAKAQYIGDSVCLVLISRNHSSGQSLAFEVANTCPYENFTLDISAVFENLKLSRKLPFEMTSQAGSIKFAFSAQIETNYWDTYLDVTVNVKDVTTTHAQIQK